VYLLVERLATIEIHKLVTSFPIERLLGINGEWVGKLLWPAVVAHAVVTVLLPAHGSKIIYPDENIIDYGHPSTPEEFCTVEAVHQKNCL
jgi:hypothetical protein